jgi:hypothetical protein
MRARSARPEAIAAAIGLLALPPPAPAESPMSTDPSSSVVGPGRLQLEAGAQFADARGGTTELTVPSLLRVGVGSRLELRLSSNVYQALDVETEAGSGWAPVVFGAKWNVRDPERDGGTVSLGLLADVAVPSGEGGFRREEPGYVFLALGDFALSADLSLGLNAGVSMEPDDGDSHGTTTLTAAALEFSLQGGWAMFVEGAGEIPIGANGADTRWIVDAGLTLAAAPNAQLDLLAGFSTNPDESLDPFVGAGISLRR